MERYGAIVVSWASTIPGRQNKLPSILHKVYSYGEVLDKYGRVVEFRIFVTKAALVGTRYRCWASSTT